MRQLLSARQTPLSLALARLTEVDRVSKIIEEPCEYRIKTWTDELLVIEVVHEGICAVVTMARHPVL